jgi:proline iminopeptidase
MQFKLFSRLEPQMQGMLKLGAGHQMHWQASGNPAGVPVICIHGGPGSSLSPLHQRLFDPVKFWVIQYDQRGCGLSEPRGAIHANQTADLIEDIERLRKSLHVSQWHVVGGSWGGSLALLYAQSYAEVVNQVLLRSPFLCTAPEIENYTQSPPKSCQNLWQQINKQLQPRTFETILDFSHRVFCLENDMPAQVRLAQAWFAYESAMSAFPLPAPTLGALDDHALIARYKIQMHYLKHRCFVTQSILERVEILRTLDLKLIHGEQDALCPFENSLAIQQAAPQAQLVPISGVGHNMFDERMLGAMLAHIAGWA